MHGSRYEKSIHPFVVDIIIVVVAAAAAAVVVAAVVVVAAAAAVTVTLFSSVGFLKKKDDLCLRSRLLCSTLANSP